MNDKNQSKKTLGSFNCAISHLTACATPKGEPSAFALTGEFLFYPAVGLIMGIIASLPVFILAKDASPMQGTLLISGIAYIFILEWLSGFKGFASFAKVCDANSYIANNPCLPQEVLQDSGDKSTFPPFPVSGVGAGCTALLVTGKVLACYLILMRLALFENTSLLIFIFIMIPAWARMAVMYFATQATRSGFMIFCFYIINLIIFIIVSGIFLGLCRISDAFVSGNSIAGMWDAYKSLSMSIPDLLTTAFKAGSFLVIYILIAGALTAVFWSKKKDRICRINGITRYDFFNSIIESGELAFLAAFVVIVDKLTL